MVECLTRDRRAAGPNLIGVTFQENRSSFLRVLFKRIPFCLELPVYITKGNVFNIITFCLQDVGAICFVVSGSAPVADFTQLCLKAVTKPNSAEPTELTERSLFLTY